MCNFQDASLIDSKYSGLRKHDFFILHLHFIDVGLSILIRKNVSGCFFDLLDVFLIYLTKILTFSICNCIKVRNCESCIGSFLCRNLFLLCEFCLLFCLVFRSDLSYFLFVWRNFKIVSFVFYQKFVEYY